MNGSQLSQDIRMAVRAMAREKGFTLAALMSLALGIGANTALFSVVYGVLMRPLPYRDPDRLVRLSEYHPGAISGVSGPFFTNFTYHAWTAPKSLEGIAAFSTDSYADTTAADPVRLDGASVSPSIFALLGVRPALGRLLVEDDAREGAPPVVVLADGFWRERFGSSPSAIGKTLTLDGKVRTIVGVAPPDFYFPEREGRLWIPTLIPMGSADPKNQSIRLFGAIARLRDGFTPQQAAEEGTLVARGVPRPPVADALFGKGGPVAIKVETILSEITGRVRPALLLFTVGAAFILLIACANVASLQLTRGISREREIAVRLALGAGRGRVVRQLVTESLVLSSFGGMLGLALGAAFLKILPSLAPASFPRLVDISMDGRALSFAFFVSVAAGLVSGLLPALRSTRSALVTALRDRAATASGPSTVALRNGLVALEAALAVMLLISAGLLARSFVELMRVDPGYEAGHVLVASLETSRPGGEPEKTRAFADELLTRLRALPGVIAAGASNMTPLDQNTAVASLELTDRTAPEARITARATSYAVTPGFAEALSLGLKEGRLLREDDQTSGTAALLVNEEFARLYLSDGRPVVGRRLAGMFRSQPEVITEIVGVVRNILKDGLDAKPQPEIFGLPRFGRRLPAGFQVVVRTTGDAASIGPSLRAMTRELDPAMTVDLATLSSRVGASVAQPRFAAVTVAVFALLALSLAAGGLYGAMSYSVTQRRREIGVRSAIGAGRRDIVRLILGQGLRVAAAGLAVGGLASLSMARLLEKLLFRVAPLDPAAFLIAPAVLLLAAVAACLIPAWRGAAVEPVEALRCE